jgi:hypothetical protein
MGQVPWAANDPIFWLHHCNIDRIWASWNKAGGHNPSDEAFLKEQFTFAGGPAKAVVAAVRDWLETAGYSYDKFLPRPSGSIPFPSPNALAATSPQMILSTTSKIELGSATKRVALSTGAPGALPSPEAVTDALRSTEGADVFLRLNGVASQLESGMAYDIFLAPSAGSVSREHSSYVGVLSLFGSRPHGAHQGRASTGTKGRNYSFPVTDQIARLRQGNSVTEVSVSLVPIAKGRGGGAPTIASITLVRA